MISGAQALVAVLRNVCDVFGADGCVGLRAEGALPLGCPLAVTENL